MFCVYGVTVTMIKNDNRKQSLVILRLDNFIDVRDIDIWNI